jgi:CBS domain-containing protein
MLGFVQRGISDGNEPMHGHFDEVVDPNGRTLFPPSANLCRSLPAMNPIGTIREILNQKGCAVLSIDPGAMVFDAIQLMADKNVGALLVTTEGKLVGIISERDYTRKIALKGKSSKQTPVKEILSSHIVHVTPAHSVEDCMRLMTEHRIRHLPVLEGDKIIGVVSIGDLVNWTISAQTSTIAQLETYITGYPG